MVTTNIVGALLVPNNTKKSINRSRFSSTKKKQQIQAVIFVIVVVVAVVESLTVLLTHLGLISARWKSKMMDSKERGW